MLLPQSTLLLALLAPAAEPAKLFDRDNLVAWCVVPFDARKRNPEDRAAMLRRLGFTKYAYDWRAEHLPTFDRELAALKENKVELTAVWFPAGVGKDGRFLLDALKKHDLKTQLWVMPPPPKGATQAERVEETAAWLRGLVRDADGHTVCLYNHGGWAGEPENLAAVARAADRPTVRIVYNLHHGHDHLDRLPDALKAMLPYLAAVNLNGMVQDGEKAGRKIVVLGRGDDDLRLLKTIRDSGYTGPIGVLGHTQDDAEERLKDNLDGLDWLVPQLAGKPAGPKPTPRTK
jgi:hypothetical protein